ncbi:MAG: ABC transporter substrate-binding protein [Candidatus Thorarchaeota archaeon]
MQKSELLAFFEMMMIFLSLLNLPILISPNRSSLPLPVLAAEQPSYQELSFECLALSWDAFSVDAAHNISETLEAIGIQLNITEIDDEIFYPRVYDKGYYDSYNGSIVSDYRDYSTYLMSSGFSPTPDHVYQRCHSLNDYPWGENHFWFHNDTMDYWLDVSMNASSSVERKSALNEIQEIAAEQLPYIPLFVSTDAHLAHKDWTGFVKNPGGILTVWNIWTILNMSSTVADGTFDIAYPAPPSHFNPFLAVDARSGWIHALIYEPLVYYDEKGVAIPWLAESFIKSVDGLTVNFTIRNDVKWHDGQDLTPADVNFTLNLFASNEAKTTNKFVEKVANITMDGSIISVTRTEPLAWTVEEIGSLPILPKHIWDGKSLTDLDLDDPTQIANFVGSGPFTYVSGAEGGPYNFSRYNDYWYNGSIGMPNLGSGKALPEGTYPKTDHVNITAVMGESNRLAGINNGLYDSERYECSNAAIESLGSYPNVKLIDGGASRWDYFFGFNMGVKPLDDRVVRQAIAYALDKAVIAEAARGDWAVVSDSVIPSTSFPEWHNPNVEKYPYNIATANGLLDNAGYLDVDSDGIREIPNSDSVSPTIDSPPDLAYAVGRVGNSIIWHPSDLNPASYAIYRNGSVNASDVWDGSSISISIDGLALGRYNFTIIVYDWPGHWVADTVWVTVVVPSPPSIAIESPTNSSYGTSTILLNFSGDSSQWYYAAAQYWYYIENADTVNQSWTSGTNRTLVDGTYTLHVYGNNTIGSEGHTWVTFTVDTTPPIVGIVHPVNATYAMSMINVSLTGDADQYWYRLVGPSGHDNVSWVSPTRETNLPDGTYTLYAYGSDLAGNEGNSAVTFTIKRDPAVLAEAINEVIGANNTFEITETITLNIGVSSAATLTVKQVSTGPETPDSLDPLGIYLEISLSDPSALEVLWINVSFAELSDDQDPSDVRIYYYDEALQTWERVEETGVDFENEVIWGRTDHLTYFGLMVAPKEEPGLERNEALVLLIAVGAVVLIGGGIFLARYKNLKEQLEQYRRRTRKEEW